MPFPTAVIFLFALCATVLAALCVAVGLPLFAVRKYRAVAPYVALLYPATYLGTVVGVATAWRLNALINARHPSESLGDIAVVFLVCFFGGTAAGGILGWSLARRVANRFRNHN
jgi:hypothetical protein